jgi:hypothetical protein
VAPLSPLQQTAIANSGGGEGAYAPYATAAKTDLANATTPLYDTVNNYESPYTSDVVNATEKQFANQNAIQNQGVVGNAAAEGAWGGDRSAVAQGIVAGQQQANEAPVIAGLENTGYQTALSANEAQDWLSSQAASQEGQLGGEAYNVFTGTLGSELQAGALQQQEQQALLSEPYQATGWLANIAEGLGAGSGGQSSTTSPAASPFSQALGLGIGGVGLLGATGAFGSTGYLTGSGGLLSGLFGGGAADAGADSFSGLGAAAALGAAARGGPIKRQAGGDVQTAGQAALLNAFGAFGKPDISDLRRGGIVHRQGGGDVPFLSTGTPYDQLPVGISVVPQSQPTRAGRGPPQPPPAMAANTSLTPQGIAGALQSSGAFGNNGWLTQLTASGQRRGGGIAPRHFQDGGDLASGLPAPDETTPFLGISPDLRSAPIPAAPAASVPASAATAPTPIAPQAPLADVISGGGLGPLVDRMIQNEGGSPKGVENNPGNIKFAGLPGQIDSGVKATDGGTFASYQSPDEGRSAVADLAVKAARGIVPAYGKTPTVGDFMNVYEGHAGGHEAPKTAPSPDQPQLGGMPSGAPQPPLEAQMTAEPGAGIIPSAPLSGQPAGMYSPGVNPWMALAEAGFGAAAGRSPQAMQNLGAGALAGVQQLEAERAALPEQQLKLSQAQMATLQVQNAQAMRAYFSGQSADPAPVANQLDRNIAASKGAIANGGETQAQATPTGIMAPLPGGQAQPGGAAGAAMQPLTADEQAMSQQVQGQVAQIDGLIRQQSQLMQFATTPEQMSQMQGTLANLTIRRTELLKEDPAYLRAAAAASAEGQTPALVQQAGQTAWAKVAPAAAQAGAEAAARLPYTITTARPGGYVLQGGKPVAGVPVQRNEVEPSTGAEYPRFVTPPLPGTPEAGGAGASPPTTPQGGTPPTGPAATPPSIAPGTLPIKLGPGQETSLKERAEEEQKDRQETIEAGAAAQQQQATLTTLKAEAPNFYTGPFAEHIHDANAVMRAMFGADVPAVASYEDFVKNAGNLTRQAVRETSPRAAVQEFRLISEALPNPEISPIGLQRVISEYQGLNDYRIVKSQAQQAWEQQHGGLGNVQGFETDFQAKTSPYAFIMARMDPTERRAIIGQLNQTPEGRNELQHLGQQIGYLKSSGLDQFIQ